jgi:hypothetical protein
MDMLPILVHLGRVNGCNSREVIAILREATELWEKRSKKKWKVAVAPALLKKYPELEELSAFRPPSHRLLERYVYSSFAGA